MRKRLPSYIAVILILLGTGCKKHSITPNYTSAKMNGNWIWIGTSSGTGGYLPDVFVQFAVTVVNDTSVVAWYDTLHFKSTDPTSHAITFYHNDGSYGFVLNETYLIYNPSDNSMIFSSQANTSSGGESISVSTSGYKPNPTLKNYIPNIVGAKALSGPGDDNSPIRYPNHDSTYNLSTTINFSAVNDSTIMFDNNILGLSSSALHYKSTDDVAKTITFQSFHDYYYEISTLTYNYATSKIVFEQRYFDAGWSKDVVLQ